MNHKELYDDTAKMVRSRAGGIWLKWHGEVIQENNFEYKLASEKMSYPLAASPEALEFASDLGHQQRSEGCVVTEAKADNDPLAFYRSPGGSQIAKKYKTLRERIETKKKSKTLPKLHERKWDGPEWAKFRAVDGNNCASYYAAIPEATKIRWTSSFMDAFIKSDDNMDIVQFDSSDWKNNLQKKCVFCFGNGEKLDGTKHEACRGTGAVFVKETK